MGKISKILILLLAALVSNLALSSTSELVRSLNCVNKAQDAGLLSFDLDLYFTETEGVSSPVRAVIGGMKDAPCTYTYSEMEPLTIVTCSKRRSKKNMLVKLLLLERSKGEMKAFMHVTKTRFAVSTSRGMSDEEFEQKLQDDFTFESAEFSCEYL